MISRYNLTQTLKAVLAILGGIFCLSLAYLFFPSPISSMPRCPRWLPHMEFSAISVFAAIIVSGAAIFAITADRFRNVPASIFALAGGLAPWVFITMAENWRSYSASPGLLGLFSIGPVFFFAFYFHVIGRRTPKRGTAAGACIIGFIAGLGFSLFTFGWMMAGFR